MKLSIILFFFLFLKNQLKKNNIDEVTQDYEGTSSSHSYTVNNDVSAINSTLSSSPFLIDNSSSSRNIGYDHPIKKLAYEKVHSFDQQQKQKGNHENNNNSKAEDKKTSERKGRGKDSFTSVAMNKMRNLSRPRDTLSLYCFLTSALLFIL